MPTLYALKLHTYCGMMVPIVDRTDDLDAVRRQVARSIRWHRNNIGPVSILEPGREWERHGRETQVMVSDFEGVMTIHEYRTCDDCGTDRMPRDDELAVLCDRCQERREEEG